MSAEWKEVYVIPAVDEEIPEDSILLINAATSDQMIHAIVPVDYTTEARCCGKLVWTQHLPLIQTRRIALRDGELNEY